jgi:phenylacetate-CoA ligase
MKLFDLSLKLAGFPMKEAQKLFDEILSVPENEYEDFIEKKKSEIVQFHLENNPFYRNLCKDKNVEDWNDLPILTKADLQQPLSQRLSDGYIEKDVFVNKTSGSSGNPMVFAKDKMCHALVWINIMRRFKWYQIDFNHSLQARFYGMPLDFKANAILRFKDFLSKRYRFNIFDLSDDGIQKIIKVFYRKKFDYINGYTSNIVLIAKYLKKNNLILNNICPSLKCCIVTSEMLFEEDKLLLEKYLGVPVVNEYGASELDVIAFQNKNHEWILNAETLFVEILDKENKPLSYGKEGKIVVTSLQNKAHPFIRYEVGDFGVLDENSTSKKPVLKKLIGRTSDFAKMPSGKIAPGMTFYSITKKLFDDYDNVSEFLIIQTKLNAFEIEYVSDKEFSKSQIDFIIKTMSNYLETGLHFSFIRKDRLERSKSGKLKQFVSLVK